jgi:KaiC domain protein
VVAVTDDDWFDRAVEDEETDPRPSDEDESGPDADDRPAPGEEFGSGLGGDADDGDEDMFEQDFAAALSDADGPAGDGTEAFGMGGFGPEEGFGDAPDPQGLDEEPFDPEETDSNIDRIDLGIEGLDQMIQGGVPERSLMVAIGSAGTGKTTFGLQFLDEALADGERAVFITLEESHERIVNSAVEKGLPFDDYLEEGRLAIVDLDPIEMANSLATIRSELPRLIQEFEASRLVLDSVSLLEMMYDERSTRRNEIYDFTRSLKRAGVTTMLTSEADADSPYASRYGIVEYLTDAVFVLQYVRPSDFRKTRLAVEIQKIRDANHSRETKPYEITNQGISVYRQANIF